MQGMAPAPSPRRFTGGADVSIHRHGYRSLHNTLTPLSALMSDWDRWYDRAKTLYYVNKLVGWSALGNLFIL